MFKKVLVAIDGSDYSRNALPAAIAVSQKFGGELLVLHVSEHDRGRAVAFPTQSPADATRLVADAVKKARDAGSAPQVSCSTAPPGTLRRRSQRPRRPARST